MELEPGLGSLRTKFSDVVLPSRVFMKLAFSRRVVASLSYTGKETFSIVLVVLGNTV